jgi:hypothetical protein
MALQTIRRLVLGQPRPTSNCPTNPADTVIPVFYFDDTPLLRNYVQCSTLRFNDVLNATMLKESLSRVIALPGWRKLGGRIRMNVRMNWNYRPWLSADLATRVMTNSKFTSLRLFARNDLLLGITILPSTRV